MEYWDISYDSLSTKIGLFDIDSKKFIKINKIFLDRIRINWEFPKLHQNIQNNIDINYFIRGTIGNKECPFSMRVLKKTHNFIIGEVTVAYGDETSSNSLANLFDLTSDGVWEWYPTENYEYMSKRFWDILGYNVNDLDFDESNKANYIEKDKIDYVKKTNSSLVPVSWQAMISEEDRNLAEQAFLNHVKSKGKDTYNVKIRYTHREGHQINIACRGNVVEWLDNGKPWRMIGTHTDITKIANYDMIMAKYRFVSRMSHEIRTPLAVIISTLDTFNDDINDEVSSREKINILKNSSHQLLRISNNVLSLSQLENKQSIKLNITNINIVNEIKSIVIELRELTSSKNNKIIISEDNDIPSTLYCDISKIRQVITNLLSNAIKFTDKNQKTNISVELLEIDDEKAKISVEIKDRGIGIEKDKWKIIFNEFVQGDNDMVGAGLGLYIAKCLSEIINGELYVKTSEINKGTTMTFIFTALINDVIVKQQNVNFKKDNYLINYKFNKILIIDDIEVMRQCLSVQMDKVAYCKDIIYATNGLEAYNIFVENDGNFDLIFMDCLMPIMDGFTSSKKIHEWIKNNKKKSVPIIAVTASISENIQTECNDVGIEHIIFKPYTSTDIVNIIKKIIIE
jgi:signal transduction histidine kinase